MAKSQKTQQIAEFQVIYVRVLDHRSINESQIRVWKGSKKLCPGPTAQEGQNTKKNMVADLFDN